MKIGIFLSSYPVFSETFVHNELLWLQKSGVDGKIWHELRGDPHKHPAIDKIFYPFLKTPYKIISKKNLFPIIKAHFYWLISNPRVYFKFWWTPISLRWWKFRYLVKAPLVALQVKNFGANLLYVHEADHAYYYALLVAKLCQIPIGIIFHTYFLFSQTKHLPQKMKSADFIIFQSNYSKNYVKENFSISHKHHQKLRVISTPGINTHFFQKNTEAKPKSATIKLITIGRLEESKGYHYLIKAIYLLKEKGIKTECKIIGYGSKEKKLIELTKSLKLSKEIKFLGKIPHNQKLIRHLSEADIFILPSIIDSRNDRDMQPNAVKEAMAMELLTITSDLGGIEEVITNQKNGFLIKNISTKKIAKTINDISQLSSRKKQLIVQLARKKIVDEYEINKTNQKLITLFKKHAKK